MGEDLSKLQRFFTKHECYHFEKEAANSSQSKENAEVQKKYQDEVLKGVLMIVYEYKMSNAISCSNI